MEMLLQPEGPWWGPPGTNDWEPHQASVNEVFEANAFLQTLSPHRSEDWPLHTLVHHACLLESVDIFALCGRAALAPNDDPSRVHGFGGVHAWDHALHSLHAALSEAAAVADK